MLYVTFVKRNKTFCLEFVIRFVIRFVFRFVIRFVAIVCVFWKTYFIDVWMSVHYLDFLHKQSIGTSGDEISRSGFVVEVF